MYKTTYLLVCYYPISNCFLFIIFAICYPSLGISIYFECVIVLLLLFSLRQFDIWLDTICEEGSKLILYLMSWILQRKISINPTFMISYSYVDADWGNMIIIKTPLLLALRDVECRRDRKKTM